MVLQKNLVWKADTPQIILVPSKKYSLPPHVCVGGGWWGGNLFQVTALVYIKLNLFLLY